MNKTLCTLAGTTFLAGALATGCGNSYSDETPNSPGYGTSTAAQSITVNDNSFIPATQGEGTYAVLELTNPNSQADTLVGVTSDAGPVELHNTEYGEMVAVNEIPVNADGDTRLTGDFHLMFTDPGNLKLGDTVKVTFDFENSPDVTAEINITAADGHNHEH